MITIPQSAAVDAVELIRAIMADADRVGQAAEIRLGPSVVAEMRRIVGKIKDETKEAA